jgi:hypothetical protein
VLSVEHLRIELKMADQGALGGTPRIELKMADQDELDFD